MPTLSMRIISGLISYAMMFSSFGFVGGEESNTTGVVK